MHAFHWNYPPKVFFKVKNSENLLPQSICVNSQYVSWQRTGGEEEEGGITDWILVPFQIFSISSDKTTALKYVFIVFSTKKISIFWCIFIVYTSRNGLIQGISSIIESSFFIISYIDKMTTPGRLAFCPWNLTLAWA